MKTTISTVALMASVAGTTAWAAPTKSLVVPVAERMEAAHKPLGIKAGAFLVIPTVDVEEAYVDNIYATQNNEVDDTATTVRPTVSAQSNWSRHELNALVSGEFTRYADHGHEDQDNFIVGTDGRYDILRDTSVGGGLSYTRNHEERGDPNSVAASVDPTEYDTATGRVGAYRALGKVNARFDSEIKKIDYKNGITNTGALVDNNSRDRTEYNQTLRGGYQFDPRFEAFVRGTINNRVYDRKGGAATAPRSSHGDSVVMGSTFDVTGKTKGEGYVGYANRNYSNSALKDTNEPIWGGKVTWNATDLTSVIGSIDRTIEETTIGTSSGYLETTYAAQVQHGLTRDILLNGGAVYRENEYKGFAPNQREDNYWILGAGADYYINRCLKAGLQYGFTDRNSNLANNDYSRNTIMLRLTGTY